MSTILHLPEPYTDPTLKSPTRREAMVQREHDGDAHRRFDAWERYRALWDAIDLKRKLVDIGDTQARLALTIMGTLNAAVFVLLFHRAPGAALPYGLKPWFLGLLVVYGVVTFAFVVQTIEALRPRPDSRACALDEARAQNGSGPAHMALPLGIFFPLAETQPSLEEELRMWNRANVSEVSAELVVLNRSVSHALQRQFRALERVYRGLKALVVLAAAILALAGVVWSMQSGG
jgi:hypothetical protein